MKPDLIDAKRSRIRGGLYGLLVGDALGVPYEFHDADDIPPLAKIDFDPPSGFPRSHASVPPGTWSDDGAQALCLLASLLHCDGLDLGDFSRRLINWAAWGYLAVDGVVFDIGMQTSVAIGRLQNGVPPEQSGPSGVGDNGNGALMRVLPLALWHQGGDASLVAMAAKQGLPTHGHPRSAVACAMYCLWARAELRASASAWADAEAILRVRGPEVGLPAVEIEHVLDFRRSEDVRGSGYVVDTLWAARFALEGTTDYAEVVRRAVALGNDTDTTAAVAGGIAGIRFELSGIPQAWRDRLRGSELLAELESSLISHCEKG
jgi:ADP-ribosyl-[dinitrogen reductase] hydrolase